MIRDVESSFRSSSVTLRERVLRRKAEASTDLEVRATLLKLADLCAARGLASDHSPGNMPGARALEQLETASSLMDEALGLLDANACELSAAKLAEAIEDLNLTIVRYRRTA